MMGNIFMINNILAIFQCCDAIRDLNEEFNKPFGWLKFKEKKEYKKLKSQLIEMIDNLMYDKWTVEYLYNLERVFLLYWDNLEKYSEELSITKDKTFTQSLNKFIPIYFSDLENDKLYILDIITANSILFSIINTKSGRVLKISGGEETNESQRKVEIQCKEKIIKVLKNYLDDITIDRNNPNQNMIKKVQQDIQI